MVTDKQKAFEVYQSVFDSNAYWGSHQFSVDTRMVQAGHSFLPRQGVSDLAQGHSGGCLQILHHSLQPLEALMKCVQMNWMSILVGDTLFI